MKTQDARIAFFGTPDLSVYVLDELEAAGILPALIVTAPDRPAGRALTLTPPPVKLWAEERSIDVLQVDSLKHTADIDILLNSEWDVFIVAAYTILLPPQILTLPRCGVLNVHPSLLPKLRGPSPIRTAIRNNEQEHVGVSIIQLDDVMDHGPLVAQATVELPIWPEKGRILDEILFREGGRLLVEVIPEWMAGTITPEEQNHTEATYTSKLTKADGELSLDDEPFLNYSKYCAYDGWPGTFFFAECNGVRVRVKITDAVYTDGTFIIQKVIPEGKKEMDYAVWRTNCK